MYRRVASLHLLGVFSLFLLSACGGRPPVTNVPSDVTVSITPTRALLAPGESLTMAAEVAGDVNVNLVWQSSAGELVANGNTAVFTAPESVGEYQVTVVASGGSSELATAAVIVANIEDEILGSLGGEGGEVVTGDTTGLRVGSGVLTGTAEVRLRTYSGVVRDYEDGLVGVGPVREFLFPSSAFVDAPAAPPGDPSGDGTLGHPFDGRILVRVPFPAGLATDGNYFVEVTIEAGGESFSYTEPYYTDSAGIFEIGTGLLSALRRDFGGWENLSITTQLVQAEVFLTPAANVPHKGLYAITEDFSSFDGQAACPGNANQSLPDGVVKAGPQHLDERTPLVLVTGWQTLANMISSAKSGFGSRTFVPQVCGWSEFLSMLTLEGLLKYEDAGELQRRYSIFTYGYDSDLSIATNGQALRDDLHTYFGDREIVILAHSMGGILTNYAVNEADLDNVAHVLTLGTPFRGTTLIHCEEFLGSSCTKAILNPKVEAELDESCKEADQPGILCTVAVKTIKGLLTFAASRQGDRDLTWQYGGTHYWEYEPCGDISSFFKCAVNKVTAANPRLVTLNAGVSARDVAQFTAFVGDIGPSHEDALYGSIAALLLLGDGHHSDGIVPMASACLSSRRVDNDCSYGLVDVLKVTELTHTELSGAPNYRAIRGHLLQLVADEEPPTGPPATFVLHAAEPYCTASSMPAVRLRWDASLGVEAYEVHRDGSLYYELETLETTFENTSNVASGQTYTYFVRARNDVGSTDSNSRTITVPLDVCDQPPVAGADLIISGLTVTPATAAAGTSVTVSFSVTNRGDTVAGPSATRIRVNASPSDVTTSDELLLELITPAIAGGSVEVYSESVALPAGLADGAYYVWVIADVFNAANQVDYENDRANYRITVGEATSQPACTVPDQVIDIPDVNLRSAVAQELGTGGGPILCRDMQELSYIVAPQVGIQELEGLQHAANLTWFDLWGNQVNDVSVLEKLMHLTWIELGGNQVSDLSALANLSNLTELRLNDNQITNINPIANLVNLNSLNLRGNQISDISALAGLEGLAWLNLRFNRLSDISALESLTNLTYLDVYDSRNISDISVLGRLTKLQSVDLGYNSIHDISILGSLTQLTSLSVDNNRIDDASALAGLTRLRRLSLRGNNISDISALEDLVDLTYLSIGSNPISDISVIANFTGLTDLDLNGNIRNRMTFDSFSALGQLTNLRVLQAGHSNLSDLSLVGNLSGLEGLYLSRNGITDISALTGLSSLTWLTLFGNEIRDISTLEDLSMLQQLDIRANCLDVAPGSPALHIIHVLQARGVSIYYDDQESC